MVLNLFPQQLCSGHTKCQFLAHVIGSRETLVPVGILRTAFKLILTNFYEHVKLAFYIRFRLSGTTFCCHSVWNVPAVFLREPRVVSWGILTTKQFFNTCYKNKPGTNPFDINVSFSGGRFKKEIVVDGQSYLLLIRDEGGPPELQVREWSRKKLSLYFSSKAARRVTQKLLANCHADRNCLKTKHYISAGLFAAVWQHSVVVPPKALKGQQQINEWAQSELLLWSKRLHSS